MGATCRGAAYPLEVVRLDGLHWAKLDGCMTNVRQALTRMGFTEGHGDLRLGPAPRETLGRSRNGRREVTWAGSNPLGFAAGGHV
jgi:hypothetical protein